MGRGCSLIQSSALRSMSVQGDIIKHRDLNRDCGGEDEEADSIFSVVVAAAGYCWCLLWLSNERCSQILCPYPISVSPSDSSQKGSPRSHFLIILLLSLALPHSRLLAAGLVSPDFASLGPAARSRHVNRAS
jgi:hypothetical protein